MKLRSLADVKTIVLIIKEIYPVDPEKAHSLEDELYLEIVKSAPGSAGMTKSAA